MEYKGNNLVVCQILGYILTFPEYRPQEWKSGSHLSAKFFREFKKKYTFPILNFH